MNRMWPGRGNVGHQLGNNGADDFDRLKQDKNRKRRKEKMRAIIKNTIGRKIAASIAGAAVLVLVAQVGVQAQGEFVPQNEVREIYYPDPDDPAGEIVTVHSYTSLDTGDKTTGQPIGSGGAVFELWADDENGPPLLVDTKLVAALAPKANLEVTVVDPWRSMAEDGGVLRTVYRTRADWDYSVSVEAELFTDPALPQSLREIMVTHRAAQADPPTPEVDPNYHTNPANKVDVGATQVLSNGMVETKVGPVLNPLPGQTAIIGQEYITAESFADPTVLLPSTTVEKAIVKVWPVTEGKFTQLDGNGGPIPFQTEPIQTFNDQVPPIYAHYNHVYPGATCYVEVFKDTQAMAAIPIEISDLPNTEVDPEGNDPANTPADGYRLRNEELNPYFARWGSGRYSLRIVQTGLPTAAGMEQVGDTVSFIVNRDVSVRGQIGTSSK